MPRTLARQSRQKDGHHIGWGRPDIFNQNSAHGCSHHTLRATPHKDARTKQLVVLWVNGQQPQQPTPNTKMTTNTTHTRIQHALQKKTYRHTNHATGDDGWRNVAGGNAMSNTPSGKTKGETTGNTAGHATGNAPGEISGNLAGNAAAN